MFTPGASCASAGSSRIVGTARTRTWGLSTPHARPSRASSGSLRSRQSAPRSVPSGRTSNPVRAQPLADEVLERGPRTSRHVEHAVHLPLGEKVGIRPRASAQSAILGRRRSSTASVAPCSTARSSRSSPSAPRTPPRGVHCPASRMCARRATRTEARGVSLRDRGPSACGRAPRRGAQLLQQLLAREEAPREEAGRALRRVPRAEVLDHGLWVYARLGVLRELAHRGRAPRPLGSRAELLEDLLVGVAPS